MVMKSYKFRIYPNLEQQTLIKKTFGSCRFVFNFCLATQLKKERLWYTINEMVQNGYFPSNQYNCSFFSKYNAIKDLPELKSNHPFLKEVDSIALQDSVERLDKAYERYYKKMSGKPKFKSKQHDIQSYTTKAIKGNVQIVKAIRPFDKPQKPKGRLTKKQREQYQKRLKAFEDKIKPYETQLVDRIKLPKLGLVKIKLSQEVKGKIKTVTLSHTSSGKYYVSLACEVKLEQKPKHNTKVGIDVGLKVFATCSNGKVYQNPKWLRNNEKRLAFLQRKLSRQKKGSHNYLKTKQKIAKFHEKIFNQRRDFLQKVSTELISENQALAIENLKVKNMLKKHHLAKAISEVGWHEFKEMLTYKAEWHGRLLIIADSNYASSQLCHVCGHQNKAVKDLNLRNWECPHCKTNHDRDYNASMNLMNLIPA